MDSSTSLSADDNPYCSPTADDSGLDPTRTYRVSFVMSEAALSKALRHGLYDTGCLHNVVGAMLSVMALVGFLSVVMFGGVDYLGVASGAALLVVFMGFIGALVGVYIVGRLVLSWTVRRKVKRLTAKPGVGGLVTHLVELSHSQLTVQAERETLRKDLASIAITKYSDMIVVFGWGFAIPIPRSASFVDASFEEFHRALARRRRAARWSFLAHGKSS